MGQGCGRRPEGRGSKRDEPSCAEGNGVAVAGDRVSSDGLWSCGKAAWPAGNSERRPFMKSGVVHFTQGQTRSRLLPLSL